LSRPATFQMFARQSSFKENRAVRSIGEKGWTCKHCFADTQCDQKFWNFSTKVFRKSPNMDS
jgi:hypothetical protein